MTCSLKLTDLWLADGTGAPLRRGTVLVARDRIAAVDDASCGGAAAERTLALHGCVLAPGFIDAHGHSDASLLAHPEAFSKVSQGVTTEIAGNCGLSLFPLTGANREHLRELYGNYRVDPFWSDYLSYQAELAAHRPALTLPALTGHNTLRAAVAGYDTERLTAAQLQTMTGLLDQALSQGSPGLSSGLLYVPGKFADRDEMIALLRVVAKHDKIYTTHLRSEGAQLLESLEETIDCARAAGLKKLHISHFKTAKPENFGKLDAALELLETARDSGIRVTCDRYPYVRSLTQLSVILPGEWADLDDGTIQKRLQDPETRLALADELRQARASEYWRGVTLVSTAAPGFAAMQGRTLADVSPDPALTVTELLAGDAPGTTAAFSGLSRENLRRILALPFTMPGSDGNALPPDYRLGRAHPRAFGTVPRFLKMLLEQGVKPETAVWRATGLPAETFGLDCGGVRPGAAADLVAFDPDELDAVEDFSRPHTPASGVIFTLRRGKMVFQR